MARPIRIEYAGALYHVTSRGNQRGDRENGVRSCNNVFRLVG